MMGMGLRNVYHDFHMVDFEATYSGMKWIELASGLLITVFSVGKLYLQYTSMVLEDPPSATLGQFIDKGWLLFASFIPCLKAVVSLCAPKLLPRKDQLLNVVVGTTSMIDCGCCTIEVAEDNSSDDETSKDDSPRKLLATKSEPPHYQFGEC